MSETRLRTQQGTLEENQRSEIEREGIPSDTGENVPGYEPGDTSQNAAQRVQDEVHPRE